MRADVVLAATGALNVKVVGLSVCLPRGNSKRHLFDRPKVATIAPRAPTASGSQSGSGTAANGRTPESQSGSDPAIVQTIYAWRLADVRRVLDLAASLPGLRRVDLVTNYRCPRAVVERAVRLVEVNHERFAKEIRAWRSAAGNLILAPDPGDDVARARRLLTRWLPAELGQHAVLARTNAELSPFAAVALEMGIPYRAAEDGLLLDDPTIDATLDDAARLNPGVPLAVALARQARNGRASSAVLAWSLGARSAADLKPLIAEARERRGHLRRDDADLILATAHGTKGLEFDHVVCIGLDDGIFPSRRTLEEADDPVRALEEERRLAYVAWTRAKKSLTLVYDPAAPSAFLREAFSDDELGIGRESPAPKKRAA